MQYKVGLVLGRFQPFHRGHLYLIEQALKNCEKLIIAVGSINLHDKKNPFSFEQRKEFITSALEKAELIDRIVDIVGLEDNPSDDIWLENLEAKLTPFEVVFGNNEWPNKIFEGAGYKVVRVELYKREKYEGTKIRQALSQSVNPDKILQDHLS